MDNLEEYIHFKNENGIKKLRYMAISSLVCFVMYLVLLAYHLKEFILFKSHMRTWQNFEGLIVYTLLFAQTSSLY